MLSKRWLTCSKRWLTCFEALVHVLFQVRGTEVGLHPGEEDEDEGAHGWAKQCNELQLAHVRFLLHRVHPPGRRSSEGADAGARAGLRGGFGEGASCLGLEAAVALEEGAGAAGGEEDEVAFKAFAFEEGTGLKCGEDAAFALGDAEVGGGGGVRGFGAADAFFNGPCGACRGLRRCRRRRRWCWGRRRGGGLRALVR